MAERDSVRFLPEGAAVPLARGRTLLAHARSAGIDIVAPCGGEGRCGKCRVVVRGPTAGGDDPGLLSPEELRNGVRLSCRCVPSGGAVEVTIPAESRPARLLACVEGRVIDESAPPPPLRVVRGAGHPFGVALDIGTSTLAGALVDLRSGAVKGRAAADNPQMACGEDLISRIVFAEETEGGLATLRALLLDGVGSVIDALVDGLPAGGEIVEVTGAGNTIMSHVLWGIDPAPVRRPPFRPVVKEYPVRPGSDIGVGNAGASWRLFPSIGGFVGGDIVAGLLASGMLREPPVSLFFDVGTNGEVVLGNREWAIACSSSAGPAFEGGEVSCGMRASPGAIDSVRIDPVTKRADWTVMGEGPPRGICGSGIIDLCAGLFRAGLIDRAGRFTSSPEAPWSGNDRERAYVVVPRGAAASGREIAIAAHDIKSVLRTKAALCAAADALLAAVGLPRSAVERVFVAGGFGNFIDLRSALALGVFPPYPPSAFVPLGNASLAGAIGVLRNRRRWEEAERMGMEIAHHDLSSDMHFMEAYQRALFIPHTDAESYRSILAAEGLR